MSRPGAWQAGVSLAEMLVVVAVLAVAATIAVPSADVVSPAVADAAASQVAEAMRFARREALRTRTYHVVRLDPAAQTLRVYRLRTSGPVAEDTANPVKHPVDRRTYLINFSKDPAAATIVGAVFRYQNGATTNYASFGPDGAPADIHGWLLKDVDPLKNEGVVTIRRGNAERTVRLAPVTGRVTL